MSRPHPAGPARPTCPWRMIGDNIEDRPVSPEQVFILSGPSGVGKNTLSDRLLPAVTLGSAYAAYIARLTRGSMLEVLPQDYVRTAYAKGLPKHTVILRHAFRNAVLPLISFLGPATAGLITGSFVVETIFQIPGLGRMFVMGTFNRDYSLVLGLVVFYATLVVFFNTVVELDYVGTPYELLQATQGIEYHLGRETVRDRNAPRVIDIDILYFGDTILEGDILTIPHPEMTHRRFVLQPLHDIRPHFILPGDRVPIETHLERLDSDEHELTLVQAQW